MTFFSPRDISTSLVPSPIRTLQHHSWLHEESWVKYVKRAHSWRKSASEWQAEFERDNNGIELRAWPIQRVPGTCHSVRTALQVNATTLVAYLLLTGRTTKLPAVNHELAKRGCRVLGHDNQTLSNAHCSCEFVHPVYDAMLVTTRAYVPRLVCRGDFGARSTWRDSGRYVALGHDELRIPIEDDQLTCRPALEVCVAIVLFGSIPSERFENFFRHYAARGASHVHLYSNDTASVMDALRGLKRLPRSLTVSLHHSGVAEFRSPGSKVFNADRTFQNFASNDCVARASVMHDADWTLVVDLDEFVVARRSSEFHLLPPSSVPNLVDFMDAEMQDSESKIGWMRSYDVDFEAPCSDSFEPATDRAELAAREFVRDGRDLQTPVWVRRNCVLAGHGRRKGFIWTGGLTIDELVQSYFSIHEHLIGLEQRRWEYQREVESLHIHHVRVPFGFEENDTLPCRQRESFSLEGYDPGGRECTRPTLHLCGVAG